MRLEDGLMNSQRLPSAATAAAFCTSSPVGSLPTAALPQRSEVARGGEASLRSDNRHLDARSQAGSLVWWCRCRQQAAQIGAAAASSFLVSRLDISSCDGHCPMQLMTG